MTDVTQNPAEGEQVLTAVEFVPGSRDVTEQLCHSSRRADQTGQGGAYFSTGVIRAKTLLVYVKVTESVTVECPLLPV